MATSLTQDDCCSSIEANEMFATKQGLLLLKKSQQSCATMSFTVPSGCYALVTRHKLDLDYLDEDGNTHAVWPAGLHFPYPPWVGISFLITKKTTVFCIIVEDCRTKDSVTVNIDVVLTFRIMGDPNLGEDTNLVRKFVYELTPAKLDKEFQDIVGECIRDFVRSIDHSQIYDIQNDTYDGTDVGGGVLDFQVPGSSIDGEINIARNDLSPKIPNEGNKNSNTTVTQIGKKADDIANTLNEHLNSQGIEILSVIIKNVLIPREVQSQMEGEALSISTKDEELIFQEDATQSTRMKSEIRTMLQRSSEEVLQENQATLSKMKLQKAKLNIEKSQTRKSATNIREESRGHIQKINARMEYEIQSVRDKTVHEVTGIELKTRLLIAEQIASAKQAGVICHADASLDSAKEEAAVGRVLANAEGKTFDWNTKRNNFITGLKKIGVYNKLASNNDLIINSSSDESANLLAVADRLIEKDHWKSDQLSPISVAAEIALLEQIRLKDDTKKHTSEKLDNRKRGNN